MPIIFPFNAPNYPTQGSIKLKNGKVLMQNGKVLLYGVEDIDCCCGGCTSCPDPAKGQDCTECVPIYLTVVGIGDSPCTPGGLEVTGLLLEGDGICQWSAIGGGGVYLLNCEDIEAICGTNLCPAGQYAWHLNFTDNFGATCDWYACTNTCCPPFDTEFTQCACDCGTPSSVTLSHTAPAP